MPVTVVMSVIWAWLDSQPEVCDPRVHVQSRPIRGNVERHVICAVAAYRLPRVDDSVGRAARGADVGHKFSEDGPQQHPQPVHCRPGPGCIG